MSAYVDRDARDRLALSVEEFMDARTTAFAFENNICEIVRMTHDDIVHKAYGWLASFFLEDQDWTYKGDKESWDFLQRVLLLLRSDARIAEFQPHWRIRLRRYFVRLLAAVFLIAYITAWLVVGPSIAVWFHFVGFTALAVGAVVSSFKSTKRSDALFPFNSVSELLAVRRTVPDFKKRRFHASQTVKPTLSRLRRAGLLIWEGIGIAAYAVMLVIAGFLLFCGIPLVALMLVLVGYGDLPYTFEPPHPSTP